MNRQGERRIEASFSTYNLGFATRRLGFAFSFLFVYLASVAQTYNGKGLIWEMDYNKDPRVAVKFATTGINIGGYEGTTVVVKNLTPNKIYIELRLTLSDYCGGEKVYHIKSSIKAKATLGGSTWMGGSEQNDFSTQCKQRRNYDKNFDSKISNARLHIVSLKEISESGSAETASASGGSSTGTPKGTSYYDDIKKKDQTPGVQNTTTGSGYDYWGEKQPQTSNADDEDAGDNLSSSLCPPQGLSMVNKPGANCVQLRWMSQSTIQFNDKSNELRTTGLPASFVLQYKKTEDIYWKELDVQNYHLAYNLSGLDACTKYEARLQRNCGGGNTSVFSNPVIFTTACTAPTMVRATIISSTSATISSRYAPGINVCGASPAPMRVVEYKSQSSNWETVICNAGEECVLYNLLPNTSYRVRMRYGYPNNKYSTYTNEFFIKTKS